MQAHWIIKISLCLIDYESQFCLCFKSVVIFLYCHIFAVLNCSTLPQLWPYWWNEMAWTFLLWNLLNDLKNKKKTEKEKKGYISQHLLRVAGASRLIPFEFLTMWFGLRGGCSKLFHHTIWRYSRLYVSWACVSLDFTKLDARSRKNKRNVLFDLLTSSSGLLFNLSVHRSPGGTLDMSVSSVWAISLAKDIQLKHSPRLDSGQIAQFAHVAVISSMSVTLGKSTWMHFRRVA